MLMTRIMIQWDEVIKRCFTILLLVFIAAIRQEKETKRKSVNLCFIKSRSSRNIDVMTESSESIFYSIHRTTRWVRENWQTRPLTWCSCDGASLLFCCTVRRCSDRYEKHPFHRLEREELVRWFLSFVSFSLVFSSFIDGADTVQNWIKLTHA